MRRKPGRIALAAISILCSLILAACNCAPTLRYVSVAPTSATIFAAAITSGGTTTILPCTTQQFAATGYYSDGTQKDISSTAGWGSSNTSAATINASGLASSVAAVGATGGTSVITASSGGASATANLAVDVLTVFSVTPQNAIVPLGGTQQFKATGFFNVPGSSTQTTMDITTLVTWSVPGGTTSSDGSTNSNADASIGTATGLLTLTSQPSVGSKSSVTATICTMSGSATYTVGNPTATVLQIRPDSPSIFVGQAVPFTATLINPDGSTTAPTGVTWASGTTTVATITASGMATGVGPGTSSITATMGTGSTALMTSTTLTVSTAVARFAYLANASDNSISGYAPHAATGAFISLGKVPAVAPQQVIPHPSGKFLYSFNGDSTISVYDLDPVAGEPTSSGLAPTPIPGGTGTNRAAIDPSGSWLYAIDNGLTSVFIFAINQGTGALTAIPSTAMTGTGPADILVAPNGKFLYVINNTGNSVSAFSIGATGALTPITGPTTVLDMPAFSAIDPTGTYLFVPNNGPSHTIVPFTIGSTGSLTAGTTFTESKASALFAVAVDPTSKFLYAEDSPTGNGNLFALSIGSGGALTATLNSGNPYPLGGGPTGVAVDPTGKIVTAANSFDNTLSVFTAAADGSLTADSLVETGLTPQFPVFVRGTAEAASSVAAVVTANTTHGTLSAFTVSSTGALTEVGTPFAALTGNSQVAANGSSVFTTSASAKELGGYTVNPASSTATFTQIASPFVLPGAGGSVVVDATGLYVYVADTTNNTIASHKTTDLSLLAGPYAVAGGVLALATDPQTTLVYALGTNTITAISTQAATGALTVPAGQTFTGTWVAGAVSPGGKFLAAVNSATNQIQVFLIAAGTGTLSATGLTPVSIPGGMTPSSVAFDPRGRFVVVTDSKANTVTPFTIDSTGKLTAGTALTTPTGATQAVIDPNGLFLFVGVFGNPTASTPVAGGVQAYTISTKGTLTFTAVGTPVNADLGTWGVGVLNTVQ